MAKIQTYEKDSTPWLVAKPDPGSDQSSAASRERHPGGDDEPQLFDVKLGPNGHSQVHTHEEDEIIYIVAGQMQFGQHTLNPGDSIYIPGMVLYSFKAGPEGLQFINFRPRKDISYYRKDEFIELQKMAPEARAQYRERLIRARREQVGWG